MFYLNVLFLDEITPLEQLYLAWTSLRILDTIRCRNHIGAEVQGEVLSSGAAIASHCTKQLNSSYHYTISKRAQVPGSWNWKEEVVLREELLQVITAGGLKIICFSGCPTIRLHMFHRMASNSCTMELGGGLVRGEYRT